MRRGFTLIELLVGIVIIGILATLTTVGLSSIRSKSRDAKRITDIRQLQTALELYRSDHNVYPSTLTAGEPLIGLDGTKYLNEVPSNPSPQVENICEGGDYSYAQLSGGNSYKLIYCLAGKTNDIVAGYCFASPGSICQSCATPSCFTCGDTVDGLDSLSYGTVLAANGRCWLDRNLGATQVATASNDSLAYGHLYQWGRGIDGHSSRTSLTTATLSSGDVPGHANFILNSVSDWNWRSTQNNSLWQGVNGINNPCPAGFRLPTATEFTTEFSSWVTDDAAGAFASTLKLTVAGYRNGGTGTISGTALGMYWTSVVNGLYANRFTIQNAPSLILAANRSNGMSVRCIKD